MPLYPPTGSDDFTTISAAATDALGPRAAADTRAFPEEARGWLDRIESVIERYPWPTLLLALGIGYALSRKTR
jgi:hypothetical protein